MAFNPISIDGPTPPEQHRDHASPTSSEPLAIDGRPLLSAHHSHAEALRLCALWYYHDYHWRVPFPQQPAVPLLYYPEAYKAFLHDPTAIGVTQADLQAMRDGVLERIPLAYYPMRAEDVQAARARAEETARQVQQMQASTQAAGKLERPFWGPQEVNSALDARDLPLLDTDLDSELVQKRDLPSLMALQRPLYTEMGAQLPEERHAARLERALPGDLKSLSRRAGLGHGPGSPGSPGSPQGPGASAFETEVEAESKERQWREAVQSSFRRARTLDVQYEHFLQELAHTKLGLDRHDPAHVELGQQLWQQLFHETTASQQRYLWHKLCLFSSQYGTQPHRDLADALQSDVARGFNERERRARRPAAQAGAAPLLADPTVLRRWHALLERYTEAVRGHVATAGGVEARRTQLQFSGDELDPLSKAAFAPELPTETMLRRLGQTRSAGHAALPIYPVEVMPLFPSGVRQAAAAGGAAAAEGELDFLAEGGEGLRHLVLPGAVDRARQVGPHVLVNDMDLLIADAPDATERAQQLQPWRREAPPTAEGSTLSYHLATDSYKPLWVDAFNTSSYLVQIQRDERAAQQQQKAKKDPERETDPTQVEKGLYNKEGYFAVYDRIGARQLYVKDNKRPEDVAARKRYVLAFGSASALDEAAAAAAAAQRQQAEAQQVGEADEPTPHTGGRGSPAGNGVGADGSGEEAQQRAGGGKRPREE